ncbi:beta-N-acetylhexosaminidase [Paenibacillus sp. sgz500958]|uniref:beta-N-acetylhexosaminidase n=1 Tax=Paenibacillus sp. sgz500958 TaxID=3242475 RepID=UPI0036D30FAD
MFKHPLLSSISTLILCTFVVTGCVGSNTGEAGQASAAPAESSAPTIVTSTPRTTATPAKDSSVKPTATVPPATDSIKDSIAATIAGMSLEDKIGQMLLVGIEGTALDANAKRMITEDKVGGIILYANNISDLPGMVKLINQLKNSNTNNAAPLFISVDQEGGKVSRLPKEFVAIPSNKAVGDTGKVSLARTMGQLLGKELRLSGFNMDFAPVLDVNSNPKNPVIGDRSFGSAASLVTKMGIAEMTGLRSAGVIPVVKHFPGHGDTGVDSHLELPVVNKTPAQLSKLEWIPFQAAVREQAEAVMVAHILFPKLDPDKPASLSKPIIGDLLRTKMGFKGVVITDDLTMGAIMKHYSLSTAAVDTIKAGSDILLIAHGYDNERAVVEQIQHSVEDGTIPESRIDESVLRILTLKNQYKLSDKQIQVPALTSLNQEIRSWRKQILK